ncbi:MAG: hypothetical protein R3E11_00965 [Sphingobium sp.]|nr:hypothetical protein [Sphingobium sp.]MCP5400121.1 hypothetical protein [Sphingomonas sp.]
MTSDKAGKLTIYSPAPPANPMHKLNLLLADVADERSPLPVLDIPPLALPQSITGIASNASHDRAAFWPIVTTVDFALARAGAGPDWHGYPRPCPDLKFVSRLYDVGFGIALWNGPVRGPDDLRGKRIAAPPRPSAVRLMTEVLLRDGWNILDEVTLVDMVPPAIAAAKAAGEIDGTSWNLVVPNATGYAAILPADLVAPEQFVPVDEAALARINGANQFTLAHTDLLDGAPPLLSFAQALAAWDEADPAQLTEMLTYIEAKGGALPGYPGSVEDMAIWPGLKSEAVHPVARSFFAAHGIDFQS